MPNCAICDFRVVVKGEKCEICLNPLIRNPDQTECIPEAACGLPGKRISSLVHFGGGTYKACDNCMVSNCNIFHMNV